MKQIRATSILFLISFYFLFLSIFPLNASDGVPWQWLNPLPQGNELKDIWGTSSENVFAVGEHGTILHYNGDTWTQMPSGTFDLLNGLWGDSPTNIFAVGENGVILHCDGKTWTKMNSGTTTGLNDIWGSSTNNIFAVGNEIILHYDGSIWKDISPETSYELHSVWGTSATDVFASGSEGTILHYDGKNWIKMESGYSKPLYDTWGTSADNLFAVGGKYGTILNYDGTSWTIMQSPSSELLYGIWGTSATNIFAVGYSLNHIIIFHYNGSKWEEMSIHQDIEGVGIKLNGIWGTSEEMFAVGTCGMILHYDGNQWTSITKGFFDELRDIWGSSDSNVFVAAKSRVLKYDGHAWSEMITIDEGKNPQAIWGNSKADIFIVGDSGTILHYDGNSWKEMESGATDKLTDIWGTSENDMFAVGSEGIVLHYDGSTWNPMSFEQEDKKLPLYAVWGSSGTDVFTLGLNGAIFHYQGDALWRATFPRPISITCYGIWGNSDSIFAASDYGGIIRYDGELWSEMSSGVKSHFRGVWGGSEKDVFAVGYDGTILHYDGNVWKPMNSGTSSPFFGVWGSSVNNIFAVGTGGKILHKGPEYPMTVTAPVTGNRWHTTQSYTITWQTESPDNDVSIYLEKGENRQYTIAENAPNTEAYQWTIPADTLLSKADQGDDYTVVMCNENGCGTSEPFGIYFPCPPIPSGFTASVESSSSIRLSWGSAYGATGFEVYDCNTNSLAMRNQDSFSDSTVISGLTPDTYYRYKMRAISSSCESGFTSCQGATTLLLPPAITSVSPLTAISDEPATFVVNGEHLIAGMEFQTEQCTDVKELPGGSSSERFFQCTPLSTGKKEGWIKENLGGNLLYSFFIEIKEPVLKPLFAPNIGILDYFGKAFALSDEYAVIGATAQLNPEKAGSVYIFKRHENGWQYEKELIPSSELQSEILYSQVPNLQFGKAVSVSGNRIIVSSEQGDYIFRHDGSTWIEEAILNGSKGKFGDGVAIFGDYAVVQGGYVFHYDGISWKEQVILNPNDEQSPNGFGCSVAAYGDYVIVGAPGSGVSNLQFGKGAAYVFKRNGTNWTLQSTLIPSDALSGDAFGKSVSIYGDYAIVGAPQTGEDSSGGSAYIFKLNGNQWEQAAKLTCVGSGLSPEPTTEDYLGSSVSICGDYAVIGASDAVYLFKKSASGWTDMTETLKLPYENENGLGIMVSINRDYLFIGDMANSENGASAGKAYTYGPFSSQIVTDMSPPVTTASPEGGVFASKQDVVLSCYDVGNSGCSNIFYTTDGSVPTDASISYSNPIPVEDQLILKFFSVDHSDNAESVRTAIYTIDTVVPFIRIDEPQDGWLESLSLIKGTASDTPGGLANVEVKITDGKWFLTRSESGDKYFTKKEKWITAEGMDSWFLDFDNVYYRFNTPYTIMAKAADKAGNRAESDSVAIRFKGLPGKESEITCELSRPDKMIIGEPLVISGVISPEPNRVSGVNIALIPPNGEIIHEPTFTGKDGKFSYELPCGVILEQGEWQIQASWAGDQNLTDAESEFQSLEVSKAPSDIRLDVTSESIKIGEKVTLSGKFLPRPYCNGGIQDISIWLVLTTPDEVEWKTLEHPDEKGHFKFENFFFSKSLGKYKIKAVFEGNQAYKSSESQIFEVSVRETAGYAIVVQGKISSEEGRESHQKTADFVYKTLKDRHLPDDDIIYLNYETNPSEDMEIDDMPSKAGVKDAITQWAKDKMNEKPANLYIVMVDHGGTDTFFTDPETISAKELNEWVDTLQAGLTGDASEQEISIILGFCRSGSFIDDLSGENRIIITSAAENESSYKGALDQDNIRDGEFFISEFFKSVSFGKSVKKSFEEAVVLTERFTYSEVKDNNAKPYYDNALQHPLLDDNGDGKGINDLSGSDKDGNFSNEIIIGVSKATANHPGDVRIIHVGVEPKTLTKEGELPFLWAKADDVDRVTTIWCEVKPPNYSLINADEKEQQLEMNLAKKVYSQYNPSTEQYEWIFSANNPDTPDFSEPGMYQIFFFAKDFHTGNVSSPAEVRVYRAKSDNQPPDNFSLVSPENDARISPTYFKEEDVYLMVLEWEDTTDPDGDHFSYTVILSKTSECENYFSQDDFDDTIRIEGIKTTRSLIKLPATWVDNNEVYWKIQAIDEYGAVRESDEVRVFYAVNDNNSAFIEIYIIDCLNQQPVNDANVTMIVGKEIENIPLKEGEGKYSNVITLYGNDEVRINLKANKYRILSKFISIKKGDLLVLNFGLIPESPASLQTAISVLQVISGLRDSTGSACISDIISGINNDDKIGLEEAVYLLQNAALLRE